MFHNSSYERQTLKRSKLTKKNDIVCNDGYNVKIQSKNIQFVKVEMDTKTEKRKRRECWHHE